MRALNFLDLLLAQAKQRQGQRLTKDTKVIHQLTLI
jgi:hypothetical protein